MRNAEIKEMFFSSSEQNNQRRRYIEKMSFAEDIIGLDVCEMDRRQAIEAVELVGNSYDVSTYETLISHLKAYARWCYDNGLFLDSKLGILGISASDVNPVEFIKRHVFVNEEDLIENMRSLVPIYDGLVEVVSSIFAWIGIPEPLEISDDDVLVDVRKVIHNGVVIVDGFSDFVHQFFVQYRKLRFSTRENGTTVYQVVKDESYNTFIKQFCSMNSSKRGKKLEIRNIQVAISKLNDRNVLSGNVPRFTYRNIMKSGSLFRLYSAECCGLDVFDSKNKEVVEGFFSQYDYRSIVWLYSRYKDAFSL